MFKLSTFEIPDDWLTIETIEMHTGGEPLRVILDGFPELKGNSVLEYRSYIRRHFDHLRTALMFEPRGHADMYGVVVTPSEIADFGVVFLHNEGYSTMCGHATIAVAKLAVEAGWVKKVEPETKILIEAPCGVLTAYVKVEDGRIQDVRFLNVPSYVVALDQVVEVPGLGQVRYDLAYGGAFYAYVDRAKNNFSFQLNPHHYQQIIEYGTKIKHAVIAVDEGIVHPFESDLSFLYGTIFTEMDEEKPKWSRNVCVFADGEVDRSPTGSGVAGRVAIHQKRGELTYEEVMTFESITGSTFRGSLHKEVDYGKYSAVIPKVESNAYITGYQTFVFDPDDPVKSGFILR